MESDLNQRGIERLLRQQKMLGEFGTFAFRQEELQPVLNKAAQICAEALDVPFGKVCRYRELEGDLLVVAGYGWKDGVVGVSTSVANETSPQGRAFKTGNPQICPNISETPSYSLPAFYPDHKILSTIDVIVAAKDGPPFGILEVDSQDAIEFDEHDIDFLTGFANVLAEAVATTSRADALRKTLKRMEQLVEEKEVLAVELKHRVRNNLHLVYALLTSELAGRHDEHSKAAFRSIALRVMGLAEVFDHLLGSGMTKVIDFGSYVQSLCANLPELYQDHKVSLTCDVTPVRLELDVATSLGIVITELVSNAYLHAFAGADGKIDVKLDAAPDGALLSVADNGSGFNEAETKRRGVGLVKRLVRQVGGTLSLESHKGTTWTIDIPLQVRMPALMA